MTLSPIPSGGPIDLQVNGYAGADFNSDSLTDDQFDAACERLEADGVAGILATVITDSIEAMSRRLARLVELRERSELARRIVVGLHIEGPFLNESDGYIGAHPRDQARLADPEVMKVLLDAAGGLTRIVTLAPERDPGYAVTRLLADRGVIVAAGHCDPSRDELRVAIENGLTMFTHLGNGCPGQLPRHDNIIQKVLHFAEELWISFIADGFHVPAFALANYLRLANPERTTIVTDAIAAAGLGMGRFTLGDQTVEIGEDLVPWSADRSHFVGSAATLPRMRTVLTEDVGLTDADVTRLTATNPRRLLGKFDR